MTENLKVQSKFLRKKRDYCDNRAKEIGCGKKGSWEREVRKFLSKQFGGSWPSILAFEAARNTTAWQSRISPLDWMKTTRSTSNSSKTRPKHASQDYPQSPEASFQKCLLLEVIDVPLQSSKFLSRRPSEIRTTGPLYLSCVSNPSSQVWYKRQPMVVKKLNDMMKTVIKGTTLEDSWKTFSNHSARKTVVKKLKTAGLERSSIVKVTGHRKEKSLDDYDEGDENEQRLLSHTISNGTNINSQLARTHSSTSVHSSTNSSSNTFNPSSLDARGNNFNQAGFAVQMPSYISGQNDQRQSFMNMNHFHQCQVTFNIGSTAAPEKPQSTAPHGEDSISP